MDLSNGSTTQMRSAYPATTPGAPRHTPARGPRLRHENRAAPDVERETPRRHPRPKHVADRPDEHAALTEHRLSRRAARPALRDVAVRPGGPRANPEIRNGYVRDIPANITYYAGGDSIYSGTAARLEITVTTADHRKKAAVALPAVSNLRAESDFLGTNVVGEVANTSPSQTLSSLARITVVCFDSAENVIAGGSSFPPAALWPGGRAGFTVSVDSPTASQIASVQASVEPEYD